MSEARIVIVEGTGLADALLRDILRMEGVVVLQKQPETIEVVETLRVEEKIWEAAHKLTRIEHEPIYYQPRKRAQWKDEINRHGRKR